MILMASQLKLYKPYLGPHAEGLPSTGLLFRLAIKTSPDDPGRVRTILAVDGEKDCITFAGDMPEGVTVQLMRANFDRLSDGAAGAAKISNKSIKGNDSDLAILISCVGRKLQLKQRVEEVESVREILGEATVLTGFYSYGEICPSNPSVSRCEFHNQTMTITTLNEV